MKNRKDRRSNITLLVGASIATGLMVGTALSQTVERPDWLLEGRNPPIFRDGSSIRAQASNAASPLPFMATVQLPLLQAAAATPDIAAPEAAPAPVQMAQEDIFRRAFGREPTDLPNSNYPVVIDSREVGSIVAEGTGPGDAATVNANQFGVIVTPLLTEDAAKQLAAIIAASPDGKLRSSDVAAMGIKLTLDPLLLVVVLEIDGKIRALQSLGVSQASRLDLTRAVPLSDVSAIFNFQVLQQYRDNNDVFGFRREPLQIQLDGAVRFYGLVLEGGGFYDDEANRIIRLPALATYDIPSELLRIQAGDIVAAANGLAERSTMLGGRISRELGMDPYRDSRPRFQQDFLISRDAIVRVILNGIVVRTLSLGPGRYRLEDLPVALNRESDIVIEVEEAGGETQRYNFSTFSFSEQLQEGEDDFGLSAGVTRGFDQFGDIRYNDQDWIVTGYYRRGLTSDLTLGANFAAYDTGYLVGGDFALSLDIGALSGTGAFSNFDVAGSGQAFEVSYQWVDQVDLVGLSQQATASISYRSEDFTPREYPGQLTTPDNEQEYQVTGAYQRDVTRDLSARIAATYTTRRFNADDTLSVTAGLTYRMDDVSLFGTVTYRSDADQNVDPDLAGEDVTFRLGLSWRISDRDTATVEYNSQDRSTRATYDSRGVAYAGAFDYSVSAANTSTGNEFEGDATYTGNRFVVSASHVYTDNGGLNDGPTQTTRLRAGTAIVIANDSVAISRPVPDSFVLVTRTPSVSQDELGVDPIAFIQPDEDQNYRAYADELGAAVLPDLSQYQPRTVDIVPTGAFETTGARAQQVLVFPAYRSGSRVIVGDDGVASMIGVVAYNGQPLALATGTARASDGTGEAIPVFANIAGRIYMEKLVPGKTYVIEIFDAQGQRYGAEIAIPADARGMARDVSIEVSPK